MQGQFNARISRLERIFSLNTSQGQFDPRIDRLERTIELKECSGQFDDRIDRLERFVNEQSGEHSYTGDVVRFYAIKSVPLSSAEVSLSPIQSGSGDPSPTNIRPISGHTGAELIRTGKNLWKFNASYQSASSGTLISNQAYVLKAGTYTLSMNGSIGEAMAVTFRDSENNIIVTKTLYSASFVDGHCVTEITLTRQSAKLNIYSSGAYDISEIRLELGSATAYEPYQGDTYSVTFTDQGTVYGGTYDFVTGKLVIDHVLYTDSGSANWVRNTNGSFYLLASFASSAEQTADGCYCNYAPYAVSFTGMSVFVRPTNSTISLGNGWGEIYATADELKAAFAQNPLQIVYKLATPIEYTLSAQQIETLLGENNVWSDAGEVTVKYNMSIRGINA